MSEYNRLTRDYSDVAVKGIDFHDLKEAEAMFLFKASDGVKDQLSLFPALKEYLNVDYSNVNGLSPDGQFVLIKSKKADQVRIQVMDTDRLEVVSVYKELVEEGVHIKSMSWIDSNSFVYNLDVGDYLARFVVHLVLNEDGVITGANQVQIPASGEVLNPLIELENHFLFANHTRRKGYVNSKVFLVDASSPRSVDRSLKKNLKQSKGFKNVIKWLTDTEGNIRTAVEIEHDKENEVTLFHYWHLDDPNTKAWRKMTTSTSDDEVPLPMLLSADGASYYAISERSGAGKSIHQYSSIDFFTSR